MIGIDLIGFNKIKKYLTGKDITWTSEDIDNPVYSKKKPLSVELQKKIFIKDRLDQGIKNFDKAARIGFGVARLHPTYGIAMNIIDTANALKEGKKVRENREARGVSDPNADADVFLDYMSNAGGAISKATYNAGVSAGNKTPKNIILKNHMRIGVPGLMSMGILLGLPDYLLDIKSLYDTVTE